MERIIVIGNNGSGKSVFSIKLGNKLNLQVIHLDSYFHLPGWGKRPNEEWLKLHDDFIKGDKWIIDGTYRKTLEKRINAADTIIFLDIPKWLAFYRMINRRIIYRNSKRPDMPDYLNEQMSFTLFRKNITFSRKRIYEIINKYNDSKKIVVLKNNKEIEQFLNGF